MKKWCIIIAVTLVTVLQVAGPFLYTFNNWCNVIQYVSGFEYIGLTALTLHYIFVHIPRMKAIEHHLIHMRKENQNAGD